MVTLDTLEQDIKYIKEKVDDMGNMWKDHEARIQKIEQAHAEDAGYAKGRTDAFNQSYKKQRIWIGLLSVIVAVLALVVAIKIH